MSFNFKNLSGKLKSEDPGQASAPEPYVPKMAGFKLIVLFSFILSLIALVGAGVLFNDFTAEKKQRQVLEASQEQLQQKAETFEKSSGSYKAAMDKIQADLENFAAEKKDLVKQLADSRSQIEDLRSKIKNIQEKNKTIEETAATEILESGEESGGLKFTPAAGSPAGPASAAAASVPAAKPAASAPPKVLSVNRKFNFAVVNIGLSQKLKIGDPLEIIRDGKSAARLQVEKLYEGFCAASIIQESKEAPVKEGDLVRQVS